MKAALLVEWMPSDRADYTLHLSDDEPELRRYFETCQGWLSVRSMRLFEQREGSTVMDEVARWPTTNSQP